MGKYSEILATIEELWCESYTEEAITQKVNEEYGVGYTVEQIQEIIDEWSGDWVADDCAWYDDMDGDHASALASAGMGTDEDYGYYGE